MFLPSACMAFNLLIVTNDHHCIYYFHYAYFCEVVMPWLPFPYLLPATSTYTFVIGHLFWGLCLLLNESGLSVLAFSQNWVVVRSWDAETQVSVRGLILLFYFAYSYSLVWTLLFGFSILVSSLTLKITFIWSDIHFTGFNNYIFNLELCWET